MMKGDELNDNWMISKLELIEAVAISMIYCDCDSFPFYFCYVFWCWVDNKLEIKFLSLKWIMSNKILMMMAFF